MKPQELSNIALHIHWAHQLYDELQHIEPGDSGEFKGLTKEQYETARKSYPIELIPAVGIMIDLRIITLLIQEYYTEGDLTDTRENIEAPPNQLNGIGIAIQTCLHDNGITTREQVDKLSISIKNLITLNL